MVLVVVGGIEMMMAIDMMMTMTMDDKDEQAKQEGSSKRGWKSEYGVRVRLSLSSFYLLLYLFFVVIEFVIVFVIAIVIVFIVVILLIFLIHVFFVAKFCPQDLHILLPIFALRKLESTNFLLF